MFMVLAETWAQDKNVSRRERAEALEPETSGSVRTTGLGGPASVGGQLEEDSRPKAPAIRFPTIDRFLQPWFDWKTRLSEEHGFQLGLDYSALYQKASSTLTTEDKAASGAFRVFGRWTMLGRDTNNPGTLVFKVENRHLLGTDIPPASLGFDLGYNGITGTLFNDAGTILVDLNWQQLISNGRGGLVIGRYDPSDYMDILGYANPWTTFSNLSVLLNTSIALPDMGFGVLAGHRLGEQWYFGGSISDANGTLTEVDFYEGGSEFFTFLEVGWTPSIETQRYFKNVHMLAWHVDERTDAGVPESEGVAFSANWTFEKEIMLFFRAGWSDGAAPLMNRSVTAGFIQRYHKSDLLGLGFNWGDPSDDSLREQYTGELFYRLQLAENFAITPSVQLLKDPANNPIEDQIWVYGLRVRLTL